MHRMGKSINKEPGFLPPDHPLFRRGAYLVGVNRLQPSTGDTDENTILCGVFAKSEQIAKEAHAPFTDAEEKN
jgi:hypothetical protein